MSQYLLNRAASDALLEAELNAEKAKIALAEILEGHFRYGDDIESEEEALSFGATYAHYRVIADIVADYVVLVHEAIKRINEDVGPVEDPEDQ